MPVSSDMQQSAGLWIFAERRAPPGEWTRRSLTPAAVLEVGVQTMRRGRNARCIGPAFGGPIGGDGAARVARDIYAMALDLADRGGRIRRHLIHGLARIPLRRGVEAEERLCRSKLRGGHKRQEGRTDCCIDLGGHDEFSFNVTWSRLVSARCR